MAWKNEFVGPSLHLMGRRGNWADLKLYISKSKKFELKLPKQSWVAPLHQSSPPTTRIRE
jgi:hypothetical protein